jgi:hypothetical protein
MAGLTEYVSLDQWQGKGQISLTFKADLTAVFVEDNFSCFLLKEEAKRLSSKLSTS